MSATTLPTYAERVDAGARWLDEHEPGWLDRIDAELDLSSCSRYIGGQLSPVDSGNRYVRWRDSHGLSHRDAFRLGFVLPVGGATDYGPLTEAWRVKIAARRTGEVAPDAR